MKEKLYVLKYDILIPIAVAAILLVIFFVISVSLPCDAFQSSYPSIIQDKYENLVKTKEAKIILIGGSSLGFGINETLLSEATGYPVVNLGLHAGFGGLFNTEIAKANIGEGDIVLVGYEYGWHQEEYFEKFGVDLVMTGINSKMEMYRYIPAYKWADMIGYLPNFLEKKMENNIATGTYSRSSFGEDGHMTLQREFSFQKYEENIDYFGFVTLEGIELSDNSIRYLRNFKEYVVDKGASIYFIAPPLYEKAKKSDDLSFLKLVELEEEKIGIPYVSNPLDYIYPDEYIFDTIYHCSSVGEIQRTEQLILDLLENGVIEKSDSH